MPSERTPEAAYVWVWLPGTTQPVVAGVLRPVGDIVVFRYAQSYQQRPDALPLYLPELPVGNDVIRPLGPLTMANCIADAGPDRWGQRVIMRRLLGGAVEDVDTLGPLTYLLGSGSDRFGALDFQESPTDYRPRVSSAPLEELMLVTERIDAGEPISKELELALFAGTSLGGARPKANLHGPNGPRIAKFSSRTDPFPSVKAEGVAMNLARRVGLDVAGTEVVDCLGRDVLLVERFDRTVVSGERRMAVSALTLFGLDPVSGHHATYYELADIIRLRFTRPEQTLHELFKRIVFNVCIGNTDDHPRNHAAFWNGAEDLLTLTPAFDLEPQFRFGGESSQAMAIGPFEDGNLSQLANCVKAAPIYHLDPKDARSLIDEQLEVINAQWKDAAEESSLTEGDRDILWHKLILREAIFYGYEDSND